ncbi:MAG: SusC/RagA family TonB-linked outer membrane protein [Gemmatimonadota bacterium]
MTTIITRKKFRAIALAALSMMLTLPAAKAHAQAAVVTGKVTSENGTPVEAANLYINDLAVSVGTNAAGVYTFTVPTARVQGQKVNLRIRAIGHQSQVRVITVAAGTQTQNFQLKQDINKLSEVVVTGSIEGTERSKVPFAVARLSEEDIPVPGLDPIRALQGKVAGMRIAQTSGQPGSTPEILMRGPTSLNASGRSQGPLIIVDNIIMNVGSLAELGGLDIESVEVVKGAAGAALYGTKAANGVITIKTKRGASQDGIKFGLRTEYGTSDLNSLDYGQPTNHHLQLDETGKRFCVTGTTTSAPCSRTLDWMTEMYRINNVNADTIRTNQNVQWNAPSFAGGELTNVFQANIWPNQYYNSFAQVASRNPVTLNSVDATGRVGNVRFYVSGSATSDKGAIKGLEGQQQNRARVNLDYDVRSNLLISVSSLYDRGTTDNRSGGSSNGGIFGQLLRGAPAGSDYAARDTLGRYLIKLGGAGFRGSGNAAGTFLYDSENLFDTSYSTRYLGSISANYFPTDWATFDATFGYDNRTRFQDSHVFKGYRTFAVSTGTNFGSISLSDNGDEAMNASVAATFRKQLSNDLSAKVNFKGLWDQEKFNSNNGNRSQFVVKDIYTLSNATSASFGLSSSWQTDRNMGALGGGSVDYKGRYIVEGTYRFDGSSRFGAGNRWASFGRLSGVWRVSEESFWHSNKLTDFRIRASRGSAGSTPNFSAQYETYSCGSAGCSLGQAGNSQLKPETTTETEIGTDFTLFNRLGVEITNAKSDTKNQILPVNTPSSLGFSSQWQNAGTLSNNTYEVGLNLPIISKADLNWSMRGTWDRTRTFVTELFVPEYYNTAGTGQGTGSLFLITARTDVVDGTPVNRYGNIWGRKFYKTCADLPASVQASCGDGAVGDTHEYQINDQGWVVWTGAGNNWRDGITKNLWQAKLSQANSPWNYPLFFGHPIIDRPLRGEKGEGVGIQHYLGNVLPNFRMTYANNVQYKRLTLYGLVDGTFGHKIQNQGEGWGLLDFSSDYFDGSKKTVEEAKPTGYGWRAGFTESGNLGTGGFYDILGPNNYNTEDGSYAKLREVSLTYKLGKLAGLGDFTVGVIGRNLMTFTGYSGYDPEVGVSGGAAGSGLINQVDAFNFPTLRTFTVTVSTRF